MEDLMVSRRAVRPGARIFARRDAGYRRRAGARAKTFDQGETACMSITIAMTSVPKPAPELIEAFRGAPTSVISDNLARLPGAVGLRRFHRGCKLVGVAYTVRTRPGDNLAIHRALEMVGPDDVIVVDGGGDETRALVGEIMKNIAEHRGAAGYVIDGAIRDVASFAASDFPCFARTAIHRGPYKSGPGEINVPVSIGGSVISPGDIVVGDEDGVVSFPAAIAATVLEAVRAQIAREEDTLLAIREGRYQGSYGKS
jgi:regulator of RNase E activity RraA